ncbi:hypothetical protein WG909_14385 [Peptostreptococcaceae bacterium AGR-M142]
MDTDVFYHEIKSREVYELQDTVNFKNKTLFISSIKGEFIKSELIFTYKQNHIVLNLKVMKDSSSQLLLRILLGLN